MDTLLYIGLGNAVMATALALLAAGAGRVFRGRPALAHGLWLLVLLKLLTPPLLSPRIPLPAGLDQVVPECDATAPSAAPSQPTASELFSTAQQELEPVTTPDDRTVVASTMEKKEPGAESVVQIDEPPRTRPAAFHVLRPALLTIWFLGALAWWLFVGLRMWRFQRCLRFARPAPETVQQQARRLAGRLGLVRCPAVWFLPAPVGPLLWAVAGSARLLLPAGLWDRLTREQRETLLAHELAHLRRRDHWVRRLELVVLGLYWWFPVAWWARREIQEAEEQCCDAWVVWALPEAGPAYAQALMNTVRFLSQARSALPMGASGVGQVPLLKRRLTMILHGTTPRALSRAGLWAIGGLGLLVLPILPTAGHGQQPAASPQKLTAEPPARQQLEKAIQDAELEKARAEVKLLRAQLDVHRARLNELEARLKEAQANLARLGGPTRATHFRLLNEAVSGATLQQFVGQPAILYGLQKPTPTFSKVYPAQTALAPVQQSLAPARTPEQRLADLEKKLNEIAKEVQSLRKALGSEKPSRP